MRRRREESREEVKVNEKEKRREQRREESRAEQSRAKGKSSRFILIVTLQAPKPPRPAARPAHAALFYGVLTWVGKALNIHWMLSPSDIKNATLCVFLSAAARFSSAEAAEGGGVGGGGVGSPRVSC